MAVNCPNCNQVIQLKNVKPGKYSPKCPGCGQSFSLTVPADANGPMIAQALKAASPNPDGAKAATKPNVPPKAPPRPSPGAPTKPAGDGNATGAWQPPAEDVHATGAFQPSPEDANATGAFTKGTADDEEDPYATGALASDKTKVNETQPPPLPEAKPAKKTKAQGKTVAGKAPATVVDIPDTLGGYQVLKELGRGGMGAVYLGKQISLDRRVAIKVMNARWASDPDFVARFTREAYAAAQLVHHNVVQIYDLGLEDDINYFSMEFVPGQSLAGLVESKGKLDVEAAVGYVLQAARGLKFGHDMGMVHRDIKPDNLMLSDQGIVKVADLGLVKIPDEPAAAAGAGSERGESAAALVGPSNMTVVGTAMGTPAYMSPEQARNSAEVDQRADIYSLGCTLYVLVTGRPPFDGKTVLEVLTKHASEPVIPPEVIVKRVPKALSAILLKMMAKKPEDRYRNMEEVIDALEDFLGVRSAGAFTPKEEHADTLESCVARFNNAPGAKIRSYAAMGFFAACAVSFLGCLLAGSPILAGGIVGLGVLTPLAYFVISGLTEKTYLFMKFRELVFGARIVDWLLWCLGIAFVLFVLYLLSLLLAWVGFCLLAAGVAGAFHFLFDGALAKQRQAPVEEAEQLFRTMRLQGLDEETLRQFVCKYSGPKWEEFYEALFGFDAKRKAREWSLGETGKDREKFATWREPVLAWIDAKQRARREAREKKHLQRVEEKSLQAKGVDPAEARRKAKRVADALVEQAAEIKYSVPAADGNRAVLRGLFSAARMPTDSYEMKPVRQQSQLLNNLAKFVLGPNLRFYAGCLLLLGCGLWVHQNDLLSHSKLKETAGSISNVAAGVKDAASKAYVPEAAELPGIGSQLKEAVTKTDLGKMKADALKHASNIDQSARDAKPLQSALLPESVANLFDSYNPGVAGLFLILSAFSGIRALPLLVWPVTIVLVLGSRLGIPAVPPLSASMTSLLFGFAAMIGGYIVLRKIG